MATRHGRSTPLMWRTVESSGLKGKRNGHEDALLKRLREVVPENVAVTVLADRGFADCALFDFLEGLGFGYVIRLREFTTKPSSWRTWCDRDRAISW